MIEIRPSLPLLSAFLAAALVLAVTPGFVAVAAASDSGYVLPASALPPALRASRGAVGVGRCASAAVYFVLGLYAALSGARSVRA